MSILIWQWSINYNKVLAYKIWTEFHFFDQNGSWSFLQCDDFIVTYKIKMADTNTILYIQDMLYIYDFNTFMG